MANDFGEYFRPETEYIDVSQHEKPVVYGLAIQGLLDSIKASGELGLHVQESVSEEEETPKDGTCQSTGDGSDHISRDDENLSDYVARDVDIVIGTGPIEEGVPQNVIRRTVIHAGTSKSTIWESGVSTPIDLGAKPKRTLRYAFVSQASDALGKPKSAKEAVTHDVEGRPGEDSQNGN